MDPDASRRLDDGGSVCWFLGLFHGHHLTLTLRYFHSNRPQIQREQKIRVIQGFGKYLTRVEVSTKSDAKCKTRVVALNMSGN